MKRAILGEPSPWDRLDLLHDEMPDEPGAPRDRGAQGIMRSIEEARTQL